MFQLIFTRISSWLSLLGVATGVLMLMHFSRPQQIPTPDAEPPRKPPDTQVAATGIVEALGDNIHIAPPVAGVVVRVPVSVGEWVKADQPLFELDSRVATANVNTAEAALGIVRAELAKAQELRDRLGQVKDTRAVSAEEKAMRNHAVTIAQSQVAAAEAHLEQAKVLRDQLTVRSPHEGAVLQLNVQPGELASPASPIPPVVMGNSRELQVRVEIDEALIAQLPEHPVAVAFLKGQPDRSMPLQMIRTDPLVVPKTSFTATPGERIDTRVLPVILKIVGGTDGLSIYIGQQVDVYLALSR